MPKQKPKAMLSAISGNEQLDDQPIRLLSEVETGHPYWFSHTATLVHAHNTNTLMAMSVNLIRLFSSIIIVAYELYTISIKPYEPIASLAATRS